MKSLKITAAVLVTILSLASCENENVMPNNQITPKTENITNSHELNQKPGRGDFTSTESQDQPTLNNPSLPVETFSATDKHPTL